MVEAMKLSAMCILGLAAAMIVGTGAAMLYISFMKAYYYLWQGIFGGSSLSNFGYILSLIFMMFTVFFAVGKRRASVAR